MIRDYGCLVEMSHKVTVLNCDFHFAKIKGFSFRLGVRMMLAVMEER